MIYITLTYIGYIFVFLPDVDECKLKVNLCDGNAKCININGSYNCQCDDGYSGDGFHCSGINGSSLITLTCIQGGEKKWPV